ncbi:glycosyltransferase family 4 protein [Maribacter halichondriae]|uniref:glycosyltransferase family 4 protein n=1 Tax=Maribacter halichondriae TaxID=2980554 RepID=UPI002358CD48|nr:glycosyltransferase family 4 protein [Maribacter sp. Hal144]
MDDPRPMNILIVSQYFWPEDFKVNDIAFDLVEKGHRVTVLTAKPNYPKGKFYEGYGMFSKRKEVHRGVNIIRCPIVPREKGGAMLLVLNYVSFIFFAYLSSLFRLKKGYDIIFSHLTSPITSALPAIWLKKRWNIPLVIWILDLWPESVAATTNIKNKQVYAFLNRVVRYIYRKSDKILVSSRSFRGSIEEKIQESEKIEYFPNWAEDTFISEVKIDYEVPEFPEGFNIMFAGNIGDAQDFESIVLAAELVQEEHIDFIIVGDGRKFAWLEAEISNKGLKNIHLMGRHPLAAMPLFFAKADAMLVSLKDEPIFRLTVPAKIQAYMASRKIILGMINGEANTMINESGCGYAVAAGDYESLAQRAVALKNITSTEREQMQNNATSYYRSNFEKATLLHNLEVLLMKFASKKD